MKLVAFMVVTSFLTFTLAATIGNLSFGGKSKYAATFSDVTGLLPDQHEARPLRPFAEDGLRGVGVQVAVGAGRRRLAQLLQPGSLDPGGGEQRLLAHRRYAYPRGLSPRRGPAATRRFH